MIKPEELYEKTKIPADEKMLDTLMQLFFNIPFDELNYNENRLISFKFANDISRISSEMYSKINAFKNGQVNELKFNSESNLFIEKLKIDFNNSGRPFDPALHNGARNPINVQIGWYTIKSWNLLGTEKIHSNEQTHRFYIPISSDYQFEFANELYEALKKANIPFYFKLLKSMDNRPDKVVIYTSTKLLSQTMSVLENVEKRRPDLFQKCTGLSPIVGKVTDNIGYASEIPGQNKSYTQIVCDSFGQALEEIMSEYMKKNIPLTIKQEYDKRLKEMMQKGYKIEFGGKQKIAIETLYSYVPSFKKDVLNKFRFCLSNNDINLNNICFNNKSKKEIETMYGAQKNDILNPEVLNRIITLPNGKTMTILQYCKVNNLEYWVPFEAKVTFKNGRTVSGREFLSESVDRLEKYNTWEELVLHNNIMIERHPNREQYKRQNFILKEQGRQIEEQMNSSLLYDSKDNNLDMNYDSSGVSR